MKDDISNKQLDGIAVDHWPINSELANISKPFVMQHALKYLLLVSPDDRFKGFAQLLGLDELGNMQSDFVKVCIKPEAVIPQDVASFLTEIDALSSRLAARPALKSIYTHYQKGKKTYSVFINSILEECKKRVGVDIPDDLVITTLIKQRDEAVKKVYSGGIYLLPFNDEEKINNNADIRYFVEFNSDEFGKKYSNLIAIHDYKDEIQYEEFYKVGFDLLKKHPTDCPFCGRPMDEIIDNSIKKKQQAIIDQTNKSKELIKQKEEIYNKLLDLKRSLENVNNVTQVSYQHFY